VTALAGRRHGVETAFELQRGALGDHSVRLVDRERDLPLEARLELAADLPVSVAEMVVNFGRGGIKPQRAFQLLDGLVIFAEPVKGPAEAVDDRGIARRIFHRALDQLESTLEVHALV